MKRIELKEIYNFTLYSALTYSPNGKSFACVESKASEEENSYPSNLRLYRDGKIVPLVNDGKVGSFFFEDDDHILFAAKREEKDKKREDPFTILYRLSLSGGEAEKAYELPISAHDFKKLPNGDYLFYGDIDKRYPDFYSLDEKKRKKFLEDHQEDKDYEELDESPFSANGAGFVNSYRTALFYFDVKANKIERLTPPTMDVGSLLIRGDEAFFLASSYKNKAPVQSAIYKLALSDKKPKMVVGPKLGLYLIALVGDRIMAVGGPVGKNGMSKNPKFYLLDEKTWDYQMINDADESVGHGILTDVEYGLTRAFKEDGQYLYFTANDRYHTVLKRIGLDGKIEIVNQQNGAIYDFDVKEGNLVLMGMFDLSLPEIYLPKGDELIPVTEGNKKVFEDKYLAKPEYLSTVFEDEDIDGWVLKPFEYDPKKKYPAILDIHGGPKCAYGPIFFHEMQYWASKGYFVMFCNPHGSDGRGNDFADLRMRWGDIDYKHIMAFVDNVLANYPQIDVKRVCCTGGSYGGYMSNWILGHTNRFCAIATQRSIMNWISMYGISDIPPTRCAWVCDTHPYSEKGFRQMWKHSPLKYIKNAKTPTLIIHSDEDHRCPIPEGYQLLTALVYLKVPAKMVVFHGENHELSRTGKPKHRIKRLSEITKWFDNYTKE